MFIVPFSCWQSTTLAISNGITPHEAVITSTKSRIDIMVLQLYIFLERCPAGSSTDLWQPAIIVEGLFWSEVTVRYMNR